MLSRLNALAWLGTALSLSWSLGAHAAGDPAAGEKKFYTCYGCHGLEDYRNAYPDYTVPRLRHQHAAYIVAALQEYRSGDRPHATMHAQAVSLSDQDMEDIAAYLQGPEPQKPTAAVSGKPPKQVAACAACHGENGLGVEAPLTPKPAVLAGQHEDYLEQALAAYKNGRRKNVVMNGMAQMLTSDDDVRIAAAYFAGQSSALATATTGSK
ncbi:MAG TPA: c-type cytochrome [Steroidobacteraceae bacterium]|jgi:cytochrome c553|nr:c-type cytochrome [Steroidobacteraceae bacterium]